MKNDDDQWWCRETEEESERIVNQEQLKSAYQKGKTIFDKLVHDEHMKIAAYILDGQTEEETIEEDLEDEHSPSSSSSEDKNLHSEQPKKPREKANRARKSVNPPFKPFIPKVCV